MHVAAYPCPAVLEEGSSYHPRHPHTTDGGLLDQDGYNSTTTSLNFLHLILQACEYSALAAFLHPFLVALAKAALHLAVAPPRGSPVC